MSDRVVDLLEFETGTPDRPGQNVGLVTVKSRVGFAWSSVAPFVFLGASVLAGAAWWYWNKKPGRRGLFGVGRARARYKAPTLFSTRG